MAANMAHNAEATPSSLECHADRHAAVAPLLPFYITDGRKIMSWLTVTNNGVVLRAHIVPRSSKTTVQGLHGDALKIRLQAPPIEGKANAVLIDFLGETLGVHPRQVTILSGESGRKKRILVSMLGATAVRTKLGISN
jgi:uncharacterized protein (TIGR00251 family)